MKTTIFAKLFFILLFNLLLILTVTLVSMQWHFKQGFNAYLLAAESKQLDNLATVLEQAYVTYGSWDVFRDDHGLWFEALRKGLGDDHLPPDRPPHDHEFQHFPPPHEHHHPDGGSGWHPPGPPPSAQPPTQTAVLARFLGSRVRLLTVDKQRIAGGLPSGHQEFLRPLQNNSQTVGWLGLQASGLISDHVAQAFVSDQLRNNYVIAGIAVVLAILSSLLLAHILLGPIKRLTQGANALVKGDYHTQILVTGRDELSQLAQDFNLLAATLERNERLRKQWLADISHELRTPLAILRGEIEAVQDGVRQITPENIQSLHAEVMSLTHLVNDLYELSIADLGVDSICLQKTDVASVLVQSIKSQQARFQLKGLQIQMGFDGNKAVLVLADSQRLQQLFVNLLENSRRYSNPGGFCHVDVHCSGQYVHIVLADTPPTVPDQALDKLFDRLYRVEQSRNREFGGAGLGLAICKAIVKAHQGEIQAKHSIYGGLEIEVTLPIAG